MMYRIQGFGVYLRGIERPSCVLSRFWDEIEVLGLDQAEVGSVEQPVSRWGCGGFDLGTLEAGLGITPCGFDLFFE